MTSADGNAPAAAADGEGAGAAQPEAKKRKLIDPFAALSQASASFLAPGQAGRDEPEFFSAAAREEGDQDLPAARGPAHAEPAREGAAAAGSTTSEPAVRAPPPGAPAPAAKAAKPKEETTRQKNARKQARGQANFTVKSNRECPDIWQGPGS